MTRIGDDRKEGGLRQFGSFDLRLRRSLTMTNGSAAVVHPNAQGTRALGTPVLRRVTSIHLVSHRFWTDSALWRFLHQEDQRQSGDEHDCQQEERVCIRHHGGLLLY